jgi:helicase HerA-like protein
MTLEMLIDVVSDAISHTQKLTEFGIAPQAFAGNEDVVFKAIKEKNIEGNKYSWLGLNKKLWKLKRAKLFAANPRSNINVREMLTPGRVSIVDVHDMDAPYLRNIVIAQILRRLQSCQETKYAARHSGPEAPPVTPVNIFIEEAHEFLSKRRIRQMPNLFDQVVRIARRGRKRHIGLVFITQLPGHLPDEVLGLINNWILHKIGDANVVQRLKKILSGVDDGTWSSLTNLPSGHARASFTHMTRPVTVALQAVDGRLNRNAPRPRARCVGAFNYRMMSDER